MSRFDTILWDVDQTLLDFDLSQSYALRHSFERFGRKADEKTVLLYADINNSFWKRHELGLVARDELLTGRFAALFSELGITDIEVKDFARIYQEALGSVYYFRDDSLALCSRLKGRVRQYAVTNGVSSTQRNKLRLSGLDKILEDIFISEELGYPKPQLQYFEKCFERIPGFQKERAIIIGDSLSSDMRGGNNAGIACCWYNPAKIGRENAAGLRIDYEIGNLWEVEDII